MRPARPGDVEALVRLRLENGHVHALLDSTMYRVPDPEKAREHFSARLAEDDPNSVMLVGVNDDVMLGLAEIALDPEPPAHQILKPLLSAHLHLVVPSGLGVSAWARHIVGGGSGVGGRSWRATARGRHPERHRARAAVLPLSRLQDHAGIWIKDLSEPSQ